MTMKGFLKKIGLVLIGLGVVALAVSEFTKQENNTLLIISGGLIVFGLVSYVVINNILD